MSDRIRRFLREEDGMEMVEWALVGALVVVGAASFLGQIGDQIEMVFSSISSSLTPYP